jgi:hypothetical protein
MLPIIGVIGPSPQTMYVIDVDVKRRCMLHRELKEMELEQPQHDIVAIVLQEMPAIEFSQMLSEALILPT